MPEAPPDQVIENRFELLEPVDGLGVGTCWKARDRRFRQRSKLVRLLAPLPAGATALPDALGRALKTLQSLRGPAVLEVIHHGVWSGRPFVVHDWFDGVALDRALAELPATTPLPMDAARAVVDAVSGALEAALQLDATLAHGALTPRDVLVKGLTARPEVRVVGIGLGLAEGRGGRELLSADLRGVGTLLRAMLVSPEAVDGPWREGTPSGVIEWIARCEGTDGAAPVPTIKALRDGLRSAWNSEPVHAPRRADARAAPETTPAAAPAPTPAPPSVAAPKGPVVAEEIFERGGRTVMAESLGPATHPPREDVDETYRAPSVARSPRQAASPRSPAVERPELGERTMALETLSSAASDDAEDADATRRADPRMLRAQAASVARAAGAPQPAQETGVGEPGGATVVLTSLSAPVVVPEHDTDMTFRVPAPSERFRAPTTRDGPRRRRRHRRSHRVASSPDRSRTRPQGATAPSPRRWRRV